MPIWVRCHLDVLVLLLIEADILYSLWPEKFPQTVFLLVLLLARVVIASLAWWYSWKGVWRKGILQMMQPRQR